MQYALVLGVAFTLVVGQALWKIGVGQVNLDYGSLARKIMVLALNPAIIAGCIVYVVATLLFMYTIGKYAYGVSYAMIVSFSLIIASAVAALAFHERLSWLNALGVIVILAGVWLLVRR